MKDNKEKIFEGTIDEAKIKAKETTDMHKVDIKLNHKILRSTGINFEAIDKDGSKITMDSTAEVIVTMKYADKRSMIFIEKSQSKEAKNPPQGKSLDNLPTSTEITISGLKTGDIYHKYEDNYYNHMELTVNEEGKVTYRQDLLKPHVVFLQPMPTSYYILTECGWKDEAGVDASNYCVWNPLKRKAGFTTDIDRTIVIDVDDVKLDGMRPDDVKTKIIATSDPGIYIYGRQDIVIENLDIENCNDGIYLESCRNINIKRNKIANNINTGILLDNYNYNVNIEKNEISNGEVGIALGSFNNFNKIEKNTIENSTNSNSTSLGIAFEGVYNNYNTIKYNNIKTSNVRIKSTDIYYGGIYLGGASNDFNNIIGNLINLSDNKIAYNNSSILFGLFLISGFSGNNVIKLNKISILNNRIALIESDLSNLQNVLVGIYFSQNTGRFILEDNNISIRNNNIAVPPSTNNFLLGIYGDAFHSGAVINNNIISIIENKSAGADETGVYGISMFLVNYGNSVERNNIIINDNKISINSDWYGIYFGAGNNSNIVKCNRLSLQNNIGNNFYGIYFDEFNSGNTIEQNRLLDNQGYGIYFNLGNYSSHINNNKILRNGLYGIYFYEENNANIIEENKVLNNGQGGIYIDEIKNIENILIDNKE